MRALEELRLFSHLARSLHFGRTATECHVTPSTLSRAISRLEADVGRRLLDRDRRSVQLTPDGVRLLGFADTVLAEWDRVIGGWEEDADEVVGTLSLFCTVTASQSVLPQAVARFRASYPQVHLRLETGYAAEALTALAEGRVDVSVAALDSDSRKTVVSHVLATSTLVPVTAATNECRLSPRPGVEWSRVPWVLPAEGLARTLVDRWFRRLHVRPNVAAEAAGHEAVLALVALGCGIGMVPDLVVEKAPASAGLQAVDVEPDLPTFDIAVCTLPDNFAHRPVAALWRTLSDAEATMPAQRARPG